VHPLQRLWQSGGTGEGIAGGNYFIGANGSDNNELCSAKTVGNLGSIYGICRKAPLCWVLTDAGMAYHARTHRIRTDLTAVQPRTPSHSRWRPMVCNWPQCAQVRIALLGETQPRITIQPAYRLFNTAPRRRLSGDMKIVTSRHQHNASGLIYLNWKTVSKEAIMTRRMGVLTYC